MNENEPARDAGQKTADKAAPELRLEVLQKTLHHIEATKHILDVSGIRPEPLEVDSPQPRKATRQRPRASSSCPGSCSGRQVGC